MTEKSVTKYATQHKTLLTSGNSTDVVGATIDYGYTPIQVASLLCFLVGVIQVMINHFCLLQMKTKFLQQLSMYLLRLGIVAFLLSDCLVSGLSTGAAFHIFSSQIKDACGIEIPPSGAYFKIVTVSI